ncbi:MAG: hypothetical protein ACO3VG_06240, partial [Nitriliruptoraceae bacterium]
MDRVTVWHRTAPARLPAIEREGLRTRADLGGTLGPLDAFDAAATGRFARGRRVSGWYERAAGRGPRRGPASAAASPAAGCRRRAARCTMAATGNA